MGLHPSQSHLTCNTLNIYLYVAIHIVHLSRALMRAPSEFFSQVKKNFTIDIGGRKDTVSVDRLKPAHIEFQVPVAVAKHRGRPPRKVQPTSTQSHTPDSRSDIPLPLHTRSGRQVNLPRRFISVLGGVV